MAPASDDYDSGLWRSKVIVVLASLITVLLTYNYLGAERYGLWMVLILIIGMMGFADLGIGNGLVFTVSVVGLTHGILSRFRCFHEMGGMISQNFAKQVTSL